MELKDIIRKLIEWAALFAVIATVGSYWINTEVERRMGELVIDPADSPAVVANATKLESIEAGQARIESKVDAFAAQFTAYLERQARVGQ